MTVVDLHPEDLLDRDARGELSSAERARLEVHLARCAACRAERLLRADFAEELDGEDRPSALIGLVQGALAAPRPTATATLDHTPTEEPANPETNELDDAADLDVLAARRPARRLRSRRTAVVLLAAAAVLAASAAGATGLSGRVWLRLSGGSLDATHASATSTQVAPTSAPRTGSLAAPSPVLPPATDPLAEPPSAPAPIDAPAAPAPAPLAAAPLAAAPLAAAPLAAAPAPLAAAPRAPSHAPTADTPTSVAVAAAPTTPAAAPTSASALFESANAARRSGDTRTALAGYDALDKAFPGSREARAAKATAGRLLLDRGDAAGALARFDAYLASGARELREESMAGRATALERMGRQEEEARAWSALLDAYPATPYAAHARARVGRPLPQ